MDEYNLKLKALTANITSLADTDAFFEFIGRKNKEKRALIITLGAKNVKMYYCISAACGLCS